MNRKTLTFLAGVLIVMMILVVMIAAFAGGLSSVTKKRYKQEQAKYARAVQNFSKLEKEYNALKKNYPQMFREADSAENLSFTFDDIKKKMDQAKQDFDTKVKPMFDKNSSKDNAPLLATLTTIDRTLSDITVPMAEITSKVMTISRYPKEWKKMATQAQHDYKQITASTFKSLRDEVAQAQKDWPKKKADLDTRIKAIDLLLADARSAYLDMQKEVDKDDGQNYYIIGSRAGTISKIKAKLTSLSTELPKLIAQLYYSYDKMLKDMEIRENGDVEFYHTYKLMKVDRNDKSSTKEMVVKVSEAEYKRNESNLGMVIESKPKGLYEYEAVKKAVPPGYNYVGNSHYGYWDRDRYGHRYWHYHSHYSYYPLFFYGSHWRSHPVYYNDWNSYRSYNSTGRTYYGRSRYGKPLYGSRGSYTRSSYKSSNYYRHNGYRSTRYKRSGGTYRGSNYSSRSYRGSSYSRSRSYGGK